MKTKFNKKEVIENIKNNISIFIIISIVCILGSLSVGLLINNERYVKSIDIKLENLLIEDGEEENNKVNEILFYIETVFKEELIGEVVDQIKSETKIDNTYKLRESITYKYDIDNKTITLNFINKHSKDSEIGIEKINLILKEELQKKVSQATLIFGDISDEGIIDEGNGLVYSVFCGVLLVIYVNAAMFFTFLRKEYRYGNYKKIHGENE